MFFKQKLWRIFLKIIYSFIFRIIKEQYNFPPSVTTFNKYHFISLITTGSLKTLVVRTEKTNEFLRFTRKKTSEFWKNKVFGGENSHDRLKRSNRGLCLLFEEFFEKDTINSIYTIDEVENSKYVSHIQTHLKIQSMFPYIKIHLNIENMFFIET